MLHTKLKFRENQPACSREEDFQCFFFTIYVHIFWSSPLRLIHKQVELHIQKYLSSSVLYLQNIIALERIIHFIFIKLKKKKCVQFMHLAGKKGIKVVIFGHFSGPPK